MKRINGVRHLLCLCYWHEEWNHESVSRWLPVHLFASMMTLECLMCQQVRRQLRPRRLERLRRMEEEFEEDEEEESSSSFFVEKTKRCSRAEHREWWEEEFGRWQPERHFSKKKAKRDAQQARIQRHDRCLFRSRDRQPG